MPLLQSFDIVAKGAANAAVAKLFTDIRADVETGTSLSQAFRKYPLYFDALFCNLVGAGEQAGILDDLLDRLATYKEKMQAIKGKIKSALFYPIAVLVVAFVVVAVIMLFVVPAFKEVFANFGADLPAPTLIVIAMSDFFVDYWYLIFGDLAARSTSSCRPGGDRRRCRSRWIALMLQLPVFGEVLRKATIARWLRTLSTMFAAGVPLVEALDSVGGASGNHVYLLATKKIQQEVSTGTSLTVAMQNSGVFPNMVLQMAAIGEESGSLDSMLSKVADIFEREVDDAVDEPVEPARAADHGDPRRAHRRPGGRDVPADLQAGSGRLGPVEATGRRKNGFRFAAGAVAGTRGRAGAGARPGRRQLPERGHPPPAEDDGARVGRSRPPRSAASRAPERLAVQPGDAALALPVLRPPDQRAREHSGAELAVPARAVLGMRHADLGALPGGRTGHRRCSPRWRSGTSARPPPGSARWR